jgi:hypothetical protein
VYRRGHILVENVEKEKIIPEVAHTLVAALTEPDIKFGY